MIRFTTLIKPALFAASIGACLAPIASAQSDAALFASHDKNGDGVLTTEDAPYLHTAIFMLDEDKSGDISQTEFLPFSEYGAVKVEDPFFYDPEGGRQIGSEPYDAPPPEIP